MNGQSVALLLSMVLLITLAGLASGFALYATDPEQGPRGPQAYEPVTWYEGATNTPQAATGKTGDYYLNTSTGSVQRKASDGEWHPFGSLTGFAGPRGDQGTTGSSVAEDGHAWHIGTGGTPSASLGDVGDHFLDPGSSALEGSDGAIYTKTSLTAWTEVASSARGAQGEVGSAGGGHTLFVSPTAPLSSVSEGDYWHSTTDHKIRTYSGGAWDAGTDLPQDPNASPGTDGRRTLWRHYEGSGAPDNAEGQDGDHYVDDTNHSVYVKTAGTWQVQSSQGMRFVAGTGAPPQYTASSSAVNVARFHKGDLYLDNTTGTLHVASSVDHASGSITWSDTGANLTGENGPATDGPDSTERGQAGAEGAKGQKGVKFTDTVVIPEEEALAYLKASTLPTTADVVVRLPLPSTSLNGARLDVEGAREGQTITIASNPGAVAVLPGSAGDIYGGAARAARPLNSLAWSVPPVSSLAEITEDTGYRVVAHEGVDPGNPGSGYDEAYSLGTRLVHSGDLQQFNHWDLEWKTKAGRPDRRFAPHFCPAKGTARVPNHFNILYPLRPHLFPCERVVGARISAVVNYRSSYSKFETGGSYPGHIVVAPTHHALYPYTSTLMTLKTVSYAHAFPMIGTGTLTSFPVGAATKVVEGVSVEFSRANLAMAVPYHCVAPFIVRTTTPSTMVTLQSPDKTVGDGWNIALASNNYYLVAWVGRLGAWFASKDPLNWPTATS